MGEEIWLVIITAICNDAIIFLFQLFVNSRIKRKEEIIELKKEIKAPYCRKMQELYQYVYVNMEENFKEIEGGIKGREFINDINKIYKDMLELDAYYEIYKSILDEENKIEKEHEKFHNMIFGVIKPVTERQKEALNNKEKLNEVFVILYNDLLPLLRIEAQAITKNLM